MFKYLRNFLEKFYRNRIILRTLQYKNLSTKWYLTPDSQLKYLRNKVDQELFSFVEKNINPGDAVWDIGSNCGTFIAACKMLVDDLNILAVEPDHFLIQVLRSNLKLYSFKLLNCAIAEENGVLSLDIAERGRASNSLSILEGRHDKGGTRYTQLVSVLTLDYLLSKFGAPDIIKIDIEGAEVMALSGAEKLISLGSTQFLIEVDQANIKKVLSFFDTSKYSIRELWPDNFHICPK